jgi:hypothetical protein
LLPSGNLGSAATALSPYQLYTPMSQSTALPQATNPYIQLIDPVTGTAQHSTQSAFTAVSLPMPVANSTQLYNVANTSQLEVSIVLQYYSI